MKKYLITYDLKNHASYSNYVNLHNAIKTIGSSWWHYLESTWIIKINGKTADQVSAELREHIDQDDSLFVVEINTDNKGGWLPQKAWDWLNT